MNSIQEERQEIRKDRYLRILKNTGIPLAIVSVACLWLGNALTSDALGKVFIVTMPLVLLIGFTYNVRYLILALRLKKQQER